MMRVANTSAARDDRSVRPIVFQGLFVSLRYFVDFARSELTVLQKFGKSAFSSPSDREYFLHETLANIIKMGRRSKLNFSTRVLCFNKYLLKEIGARDYLKCLAVEIQEIRGPI